MPEDWRFTRADRRSEFGYEFGFEFGFELGFEFEFGFELEFEFGFRFWIPSRTAFGSTSTATLSNGIAKIFSTAK